MFLAADRISAFLKALRDAKPQMDVLTFKFDGNFAGFLGLHGFKGKEEVKFLCRKEYDEITKKIVAHYEGGSQTYSKVIVTGTSGIGKSLLRFYIIRQWLNREVNLECEKICINLFKENKFFYIYRDGDVTPAPSDPETYDAVALLDPCDLVKSKEVPFRLTIVTTSASPLAGETVKCNLSEFRKYARIFVLGLCPISDFEKLGLEVDPVRLQEFSCTLQGIQYCVPRWLLYDKNEIMGQIMSSANKVTQQSLFEFFITNRQQLVKDARLPFRLCIIREKEGGNDWEASGFISDYVTEELLTWAAAGSKAEQARFLSMLENPFAKGLIGIWFENWAFGALTSGKSLHFVVRRKESTVDFKDLGKFPGLQTSVPNRTVDIELGTLYQALSRNCPSIDGFGMVDDRLIMVQMTVGKSHTPAKWDDIDYIVAAAKKINRNVEAFLVYVINQGQTFKLPDCTSLKGRVIVVTGYIAEDFYPYVSRKVSGEETTSSSVKLVVRCSARLQGIIPADRAVAAGGGTGGAGGVGHAGRVTRAAGR